MTTTIKQKVSSHAILLSIYDSELCCSRKIEDNSEFTLYNVMRINFIIFRELEIGIKVTSWKQLFLQI